MTDLFDESDASYTGPPLVEQRVREAEALLGVRLPRSYLTVLQQRNGGVLRRACCPTDFPTSWAEDHFEVRALLGIGGVTGIDSTTGQGSRPHQGMQLPRHRRRHLRPPVGWSRHGHAGLHG